MQIQKLSKLRSFCISSVLLGVVAALAACSSTEKLPSDIISSKDSHDLETIVLLGMNDLHGALAVQSLKTKEQPGTAPIAYEKGGAAILGGHIKILRSQFGSRLLVLDSGDQFQGAIESNIEHGVPMVQFFNTIGLTAATVGNHEFDFGPEPKTSTDVLSALKARMNEAQYPYVLSNIHFKKNKEQPFPKARPRLLVQAGRLKVGIIGLTTPETPSITMPEYTKALSFDDLREATLREANALRAEGAQVVVIVGHLGISCQLGKAQAGSSFRKPTDPLGECDPKDEVPQLLKTLPTGTVDAVISGHSHQVVHHWVSDVPVIQAGTRNQYYNLIYLTYDWNEGKLLKERTRIEGPVPVCPQVFENQKDCNGNRPAPKNGRGELVTPTLHGLEVAPDSNVEKILAPTFAKSELAKKRVVGNAVRAIETDRVKESPLGNLVADAIRTRVKADVAFVNAGGLRAPFEMGPITYDDLFKALPFDNTVALLTVTGKQLKTILRIAQNGSRGFFPISGVQVKVLDLSLNAPLNDLDGNGKTEPWETNRLLEAKLDDGSSIHDHQLYRVATIDFLALGGDDFSWIMSQIPSNHKELAAGGVLRDAVIDYLAAVGPVNDEKHPLVNPANPRIKIVKQVKTQQRKKRHSKRRR